MDVVIHGSPITNELDPEKLDPLDLPLLEQLDEELDLAGLVRSESPPKFAKPA